VRCSGERLSRSARRGETFTRAQAADCGGVARPTVQMMAGWVTPTWVDQPTATEDGLWACCLLVTAKHEGATARTTRTRIRVASCRRPSPDAHGDAARETRICCLSKQLCGRNGYETHPNAECQRASGCRPHSKGPRTTAVGGGGAAIEAVAGMRAGVRHLRRLSLRPGTRRRRLCPVGGARPPTPLRTVRRSDTFPPSSY
jgi:hypothetical protein